jgi:hypothetical protein
MGWIMWKPLPAIMPHATQIRQGVGGLDRGAGRTDHCLARVGDGAAPAALWTACAASRPSGALERSANAHWSQWLTLRCGRLGAFEAQRLFSGLPAPPIDPDAEERRDQRIGNWIVVMAYGGGDLLILGGLIALAKFV